MSGHILYRRANISFLHSNAFIVILLLYSFNCASLLRSFSIFLFTSSVNLISVGEDINALPGNVDISMYKCLIFLSRETCSDIVSSASKLSFHFFNHWFFIIASISRRLRAKISLLGSNTLTVSYMELSMICFTDEIELSTLIFGFLRRLLQSLSSLYFLRISSHFRVPMSSIALIIIS